MCQLLDSLYHRSSIGNISNLYSPYFPLDVVRDYVMAALDEAVLINQVHNRDPIGGSNENLFLLVFSIIAAKYLRSTQYEGKLFCYLYW